MAKGGELVGADIDAERGGGILVFADRAECKPHPGAVDIKAERNRAGGEQQDHDHVAGRAQSLTRECR